MNIERSLSIKLGLLRGDDPIAPNSCVVGFDPLASSEWFVQGCLKEIMSGLCTGVCICVPKLILLCVHH